MGTGKISHDQTSQEVKARLLSDLEDSTTQNAPEVAAGVATAKVEVEVEKVEPGMRGKVQYGNLPWGIWLMEKLGLCCFRPSTRFVD